MSNSKYNFPKAQKVQIFERVDTYIENSAPTHSASKTTSLDPVQTDPNRPLTLFYSYAHKDESLRNELNKHLTLLQRQDIIDSWYEHCVERSLRDITAGTEWAEAIDTHLNTADIILLLISADFLASDYCYEKEMNRANTAWSEASDRHNNQETLIIPIILRPCDWTSAPFGKLQALPIAHGEGAKAVTTWSNQDEAFSAMPSAHASVTATGIRKAVTEIRPKKASS